MLQMKTKARLFVATITLLLASTFAHAGTVPLSIYPNPVQFGTVAEFSTLALSLYITNVTSDPAVITAMSITGTNASAFALPTNACITTIAPNATCTTNITFTPSAMGSLNANLAINVLGDSTPVNVSLEGTGGAPVPVVTSISPPSVYINSAAFTLTVNGTGFVPGDVIYFGYYNALTTTYVSSTKLTTVVPASDLTSSNNYSVFVDTAGNQYSNSIIFSVVDLSPNLQSVSPVAVVAGSTPAAITVNGYNFMDGATVQWNGKTLPTTYTSSSQLQFTPTKADLGAAAIVPITVTNPRPGNISTSLNFNVTFPATITTLDLPANNIVWDPYAQRIYASTPSSYGTNGNSIAVINPQNGKITGYYFAGSEPTQLALSSDSQYLYVGLNGNGSVQRLILPNFTPDIDVSLGTSPYGVNLAGQLAVDPSDDHTWAVAVAGCCSGGLYFYKDSTELPDYITYPYINDMTWINSSTLYGYGQSTVSQVAVTSSGGTAGQQWTDYLEGSTIDYAAGLLYGNDGKVFNPSTGLLVGSFDLNGNSCCSYPSVLPDSAINRFFALGVTSFYYYFGITSYNLTEFTPVAVTDLSSLSSYSPGTFIPWGNSGVAFVLVTCCQSSGYQTVLVKSPAMLLASSTTSNPAPVAQTLSPASATHGGWNFPVTITGTGFVPGSQVTWNGNALYAAYLNATQLTLYVPYTDIASAGTAQIVVSNPTPGGGKSAALTFTIK
jgi:hypothetical protein